MRTVASASEIAWPALPPFVSPSARLAALIAMAAGLVCWRFWSLTARPAEQETLESMSFTPFLAMGGMWLSAIFLVAIVVTGGLALAISTSCF